MPKCFTTKPAWPSHHNAGEGPSVLSIWAISSFIGQRPFPNGHGSPPIVDRRVVARSRSSPNFRNPLDAIFRKGPRHTGWDQPASEAGHRGHPKEAGQVSRESTVSLDCNAAGASPAMDAPSR